MIRSPEGEPIEEVHLPCDMSPEYTNFTFFETFETSFKNLLELSLDQLEINGKYQAINLNGFKLYNRDSIRECFGAIICVARIVFE